MVNWLGQQVGKWLQSVPQQQGRKIGRWGWGGLGWAGSSVSLIWREAASRFPIKGLAGGKNSKVEETSGPQGGGEKEGRRGGQDAMEAVEKK